MFVRWRPNAGAAAYLAVWQLGQVVDEVEDVSATDRQELVRVQVQVSQRRETGDDVASNEL